MPKFKIHYLDIGLDKRTVNADVECQSFDAAFALAREQCGFWARGRSVSLSLLVSCLYQVKIDGFRAGRVLIEPLD